MLQTTAENYEVLPELIAVNVSVGSAGCSWCLVEQDAQLSQRDRAAGYISFGQKWKTGTGRQYFTNIIGLLGMSSTTVT